MSSDLAGEVDRTRGGQSSSIDAASGSACGGLSGDADDALPRSSRSLCSCCLSTSHWSLTSRTCPALKRLVRCHSVRSRCTASRTFSFVLDSAIRRCLPSTYDASH